MIFHFLKRLLGIRDPERDYSDKIQVWEHQRRIERMTEEVRDRGLLRKSEVTWEEVLDRR